MKDNRFQGQKNLINLISFLFHSKLKLPQYLISL